MIVNVLVGRNEEIIDELNCLNCITVNENNINRYFKTIKSNYNNWVEFNNLLIIVENPTKENYDYIIKSLDKNKKIVDTVNFLVEDMEELKRLAKQYNPMRVIFSNNYTQGFIYEDDMPF